jgi:hypothetical protein
MTDATYIMLAPIRLKDGVDEKALLAASDAFEAGFVNKQQGIVKRVLLKGADGGYADLVFFASKADADRVLRAEETSPECHAFASIMEAPAADAPGGGVFAFEHLKTYEPQPGPGRG